MGNGELLYCQFKIVFRGKLNVLSLGCKISCRCVLCLGMLGLGNPFVSASRLLVFNNLLSELLWFKIFLFCLHGGKNEFVVTVTISLPPKGNITKCLCVNFQITCHKQLNFGNLTFYIEVRERFGFFT